MRILTRLWSEDSSTSVSIERAKSTKRRKTQSKTTKTEGNQERPKHKTKPRTPTQHKQTKEGGEGASVERPDTSLARQFKHFDTKQGAIRGEGKGDKKLEALTVFSQKIQAQE